MATIIKISGFYGFKIMDYLTFLYDIAIDSGVFLINEYNLDIFHKNNKERLRCVELIINNKKENYYFVKDLNLATKFSGKKFKIRNIPAKKIRLNNFEGNVNLRIFPIFTKNLEIRYRKFVKKIHQIELSMTKIIYLGTYNSKYNFSKWYSLQLNKYSGTIENRVHYINDLYLC